jgi:hypothetical protein
MGFHHRILPGSGLLSGRTTSPLLSIIPVGR